MSGEMAEIARSAGGLNDLRVLVVEDRGLIAAKVAQILLVAGCVVVGPVGTLRAGLEIVRRVNGLPEAAVLDIDLHGQPVFPLAEVLRARRVPFLFLTGYGPHVVSDPWHDVPRLEKPFDSTDLLTTLAAVVAGNAAPPQDAARPSGRPPTLVRQSWEAIRSSRDVITESRILLERSWQSRLG